MIQQNEKFILYSNCIPVKGFSGSIICDLQRNHYDYIPNDLYDLLKKHNGKSTITNIKNKFKNKYDDVIQEYFEFLIEKEYIFFTNKIDFFPEMSSDFKYPFNISNAIIDVDKNFDNSCRILDGLELLNCKFLEIRSLTENFNLVMEIVSYITKKKYIIKSISLIVPYEKNISSLILEQKMQEFARISSIYVYRAPSEKILRNIRNDNGYILYTTQDFKDEKNCGNVNQRHFTTNIKCYTESLHHNSCLHKKISIDAEGNIRNCPSMPQSFGNIKDTTLEEALNHPDFKKYWNLTKDQIEVCKDCEFRYICTDCRAYTERTHTNEEGLDTSKPLKCGYNPYTGEWAEWSTNPLKEKAIKYYGMEELVKKDKA